MSVSANGHSVPAVRQSDHRRTGTPAEILSDLLPTARVEETHLSYVFITPTDVYKLKKAVRLDFCDFGSIGKRHAACLKEVAVNRSLAPQLYRGVVPLTRRGTTHEIGGDGAPVDWLVHMQPFRPEDRADRALKDGRLTSLALREFVDRLHASHLTTARRPDPAWAERLLGIADDVTRGMLHARTDRAFRRSALRWRRHLRRRIDARRSLLEERGRISILSTCHGDLHLQNLCVLDGQVIAYDALEFDEVLTRIDGLYDIAFLIADLWHHGFADDANRVMNRYLAHDGDYRAVLLMPVYGSLRAAIRSLVAAIRGKDGDAEAYLRTAHRFLPAVTDPARFIISGRSGTGKTTIAAALASTLPPPPGALHLRSDVVRKHLAGVPPEHHLNESAYTPSRTREVYTFCVGTAALLQGRWPVILDIANASGTAGADLETFDAEKVWLHAPDDVLTQRLAGRTGDASDATGEVMRSQTAAPPGPGWHVIDAAGSVATTLDRVREATGHVAAFIPRTDYLPSHEI